MVISQQNTTQTVVDQRNGGPTAAGRQDVERVAAAR
jgi:hypothetical protein